MMAPTAVDEYFCRGAPGSEPDWRLTAISPIG